MTDSIGGMAERDEAAIQALVEATPDTDPFAGPVQYMGRKLELSTTEAHALTLELMEKNLIQTRSADFGTTIHTVRMRYFWERVLEGE